MTQTTLVQCRRGGGGAWVGLFGFLEHARVLTCHPITSTMEPRDRVGQHKEVQHVSPAATHTDTEVSKRAACIDQQAKCNKWIPTRTPSTGPRCCQSCSNAPDHQIGHQRRQTTLARPSAAPHDVPSKAAHPFRLAHPSEVSGGDGLKGTVPPHAVEDRHPMEGIACLRRSLFSRGDYGLVPPTAHPPTSALWKSFLRSGAHI